MPQSVEAFRLQNFMAFEDTGWIELRPITLLFGRNSSGKSALIRALRLLRQSLDASPEPGKGPFLFASEEGIDLGNLDVILHDHTPDREQALKLGFDFRCSLSSAMADTLRRRVNTRRVALGQAPVPPNTWENSVDVEFTFQRHALGGPITLRDLTITGPWSANDDPNARTLFMAYQLADDTKSTPALEEWQFHSDFLQGHELDGVETPWAGVAIELTQGFLPVLTGGSLNMGRGTREDYQFMEALLKELRDIVADFLRRMIHLGPIRPDPQRVYVLDPATRERWKRRGLDAFARFLLDEADDEALATVDHWLRHVFEDMVDRVDQRKRLYYLNKEHVALTQLQLFEPAQATPRNITDMAYGVAQVLPIIAQTVLTEGEGVTVIEQPELHLHSQAQARLADMFISVAQAEAHTQVGMERPRARFIIETHSENLLLRIQRRIAETTYEGLCPDNGYPPRNEGFALTKDDFELAFVTREGERSEVEFIEVDHRGQLIEPSIAFQDFFRASYDDVMRLTNITADIIHVESRDGRND